MRQLRTVAIITAVVVIGLFFLVVKLAGLLDAPRELPNAEGSVQVGAAPVPALPPMPLNAVSDLELPAGAQVQSAQVGGGQVVLVVALDGGRQDVRIYDVASGNLIRTWRMTQDKTE